MTGSLYLTLPILLFLPYAPPLFVVVIAAVTAVAAFFCRYFVVLGIALGFIAVGINAPLPYSSSQHSSSQLQPHSQQPSNSLSTGQCQYLAHIVRADYSRTRNGQAVILAAENIVCNGKKLKSQKIQYWDNQRQLRISDKQPAQAFRVQSHLSPVHSRLNPMTVDYEKLLITDGVRLVAKRLTVIAREPETHPIRRLRSTFSRAIIRHLSPSNAGIVLALVTGNRSALTATQKHTMQQTGTSHLLAISGLHLSLIGGLAWLFCQWMWALSPRLSARILPIRAGAGFALLTITIYALLTGFDVPIQRAWVMFSLLIVAWLRLNTVSVNSLLLAAIAVMLVQPYAVVSVGFYFSFIATFIVLWTVRLPYAPLYNVLIMQCLINLTLLPITWWAFGTISLSAIPVNLLVIPWLGIWVLPWAMVACLLSLLSVTLAAPFWAIVEFTTTALWQTITFFAELNLTFSPAVRPLLFAVIVAVLSLLLACIYRRRLFILGYFCLLPPLLSPFLPQSFSLATLPTLSTLSNDAPPQLIIADERYTSALIHNGKTAIIINPGRHYRHINHAKKWQRYLQQKGLSLALIVLSDEKLSHISATQWLKNQHPQATILTLTNTPLPYPHRYCQAFHHDNLIITTQRHSKHCSATLTWFGQRIALFDTGTEKTANDLAAPHAIRHKAHLIWNGKNYNSRQLGAITIQNDGNHFEISSLRESPRLWRLPVKL